MGSGKTGVRLLACLVLASGALGASGCQPLYGGKPETLLKPTKKKKPPAPPEEEVKVVYVEECTSDFRGDPTRVRPMPTAAQSLIQEGQTAMQSADRAKDPAAQAELVKVSIDKFINALKKDPYSAEATLNLALAYDKVLRKGCALALLKRLPQLEGNPKFEKEARLVADRVSDNTSWFKGYRKDAISAVGR